MQAECGLCGKQMVREYSGHVIDTYPPIRTYRWWCKCGARSEWLEERDPTEREMLERSWDRANAAPPSESEGAHDGR